MRGMTFARATRRASNGFPKMGKRKLADKLIWCIHEAIRREDQDILRRADEITLLRDARAGGLLCELHCSHRP